MRLTNVVAVTTHYHREDPIYSKPVNLEIRPTFILIPVTMSVYPSPVILGKSKGQIPPPHTHPFVFQKKTYAKKHPTLYGLEKAHGYSLVYIQQGQTDLKFSFFASFMIR